MAKIEMTGLEEIEKKLLRREQAAVRAVPKMVEAGAKVVAEAQQAEARKVFKGKRSTGDLANSIKSDGVKGGATEKYAEVYPHGTNRRGQRNATVGFVQEYGRRNMPARPWRAPANHKCAGQVHSTMLRVWRDEQE